MHGMMITMTPPIGGYTREQCEEDALASGLEPAALYAQVHELCGSRMKDETLDAMMKAHGIDVRGLSKIDKARILVGVTVQPPQPSPPLPRPSAPPPATCPAGCVFRSGAAGQVTSGCDAQWWMTRTVRFLSPTTRSTTRARKSSIKSHTNDNRSL